MVSSRCQEEALKRNPKFLLQASDNSGKTLNDPVQCQHIPVASRPDSLSLTKLYLGTVECLLMPPNFARIFCMIYLRSIIATYRGTSFSSWCLLCEAKQLKFASTVSQNLKDYSKYRRLGVQTAVQ